MFLAKFSSHGASRALAEYQPLQKRIAGEAVGPVHSCASDFTRCVEACQAGASIQIGLHAAHGVVRSGSHGDHVRSDVDVVLQTSVVNAREALVDQIWILVREVEVY